MYRPLAELLIRYEPIDSDECISKQRMLAFMREYNNCFDRACTVGHFTGSAWLLNHDVRFLLRVTEEAPVVQNRESKELRWIGKDRWLLPTNERSVLRMFEKWVDL